MQIQVAELDASAVTLDFTLPDGADPAAFGHWVGVWEGPSLPANPSAGTAIAQSSVTATTAQGQVTLQASFERGTGYTAGYFTGPGTSDLAATRTFFPG